MAQAGEGLIIDPEGNPIRPPGTPWRVKAAGVGALLLLVGGAAVMLAVALWISLVLLPLGLAAAGIAALYYRAQFRRQRREMEVSLRSGGR